MTKKKQIVSSLIKTFMDQSSVIHPNAINLHKIADTSDVIIRGLNSINYKANDQDVWLIYTILQKIDSEPRKQWEEFTYFRGINWIY